MRVFTTFEEITEATGEELGTTDWVEIDQALVDLFAEATGCTTSGCRCHAQRLVGPFGGTIAHGDLTLSLVPWLGSQVFALEMPGEAELRRQQGPLPPPAARGQAGSCAVVTMGEVTQIAAGIQAVLTYVVEIEGETKPACVAESVVLLLSLPRSPHNIDGFTRPVGTTSTVSRAQSRNIDGFTRPVGTTSILASRCRADSASKSSGVAPTRRRKAQE